MQSILRLPDVIARTGLAKSTIYKKIQSNEFPRPVRLTEKSVGWLSQEIESWIERRVRLSRQAPYPRWDDSQ